MRYGSSCLGMYVAMYDELRKHGTRLVLIACCLAILSIGENSTAIMAALPAMASSLRMRPATVEWAVNAYLLASAVFIIMGGRSGGPIRGASFLGGRLCAVRSRIADDGRCTERNRGGGRTRAAGAGRGLCCRRNACRGDTGCPRGRTCQGGRRLDRLSVARLQHRAASGWGCDPLRRVACQFRTDRAGHTSGRTGAVAAFRSGWSAGEADRLARSWAAGVLHGAAYLRTARPGRRSFGAADSHRSTCARRDHLLRRDLGRETPSASPSRLCSVRQ